MGACSHHPPPPPKQKVLTNSKISINKLYRKGFVREVLFGKFCSVSFGREVLFTGVLFVHRGVLFTGGFCSQGGFIHRRVLFTGGFCSHVGLIHCFFLSTGFLFTGGFVHRRVLFTRVFFHRGVLFTGRFLLTVLLYK